MNAFQEFDRGGLPSLVQQTYSVQIGTPIENVYERFSELDCEYMAILDGAKYVAAVSKSRILRLLSGRYGFGLYARKPVEEHLRCDILCITPGMPVNEVLERALHLRDKSCYHEDVALLDEENRFLGMIAAHSLVQVQWGLMQEHTEQIQSQREAIQSKNRELQDGMEAVRASRSRWQSLFDENPLATVLVGASGEIENFNSRCRELLGTQIEAGFCICKLFEEEDRRQFSELFQESRKGKETTLTGEFPITNNCTNQRLTVKVVFAQFPDTEQTAVLLVDVTKEREMEESLLRETKAKMLDSVVGGIAHELNNKLSPLLGFLSLHSSEDTNALDLNTVAPMMQEVTQDAARIIRQLLEISRPGTTQKTPENIVDTVNGTLDFLRLEAKRFQCTLRSPDLSPDTIPKFAFNQTQIKQVVTNLILNAFHAIESAEEKIVEVQIHELETSIVVSVSDTGSGIPDEVAPHVFDAFFTTKETGKGTGLGLSVCRNIARLHEGELQFITKPGKGSTFHLTLPFQRPLEASEAEQSKSPVIEKQAFSELRALVADDEPYIANFVGKALNRELGINCERADNGSSAIKLLERGEYDLIISDVRMPEVDGFGLYDWIQTNHPALANRFVFVTGDAGGSSFEEKLNILECPVIRKPFLVDELSATCRSLVAGAN